MSPRNTPLQPAGQPAEKLGWGTLVVERRVVGRGVRKEDLHAESWLKDVAPSAELRKWYAHDVARWPKFRERYRRELDANPDAWRVLLDAARRGKITLLYGARDEAHNSAVVLRDYLARKVRGRSKR